MNNDNISQIGNAEKKKSKGKENDENYITPIDTFQLKLYQSFGMMNELINKNIEFIRNNKVIYICGCNLVIYDLINKTSEFILRRCPEYSITSMSVCYKNSNEGYVTIGEFNNINLKSQISVINLEVYSTQYVLTTRDQRSQEWKVFNSTIMKNNNYCIALAKKETNSNFSSSFNVNHSVNLNNIVQSSNNLGGNINFNVNNSTNFGHNLINSSGLGNNSNFIQTKFSFWKFTQELFISETILDEDLWDCSYNPKNSHELILCGKGYMRLWNVFINQGTLKEHPQRYLKNKQEKEHTFIKAEFFENRSFMFAVGTLENVIFIIEGFNVLCEINAYYKKENIIELNVNGIKNLTEEEEVLESNINISNKERENLNGNININQNLTGSVISLSTAKRNSSVFDGETKYNNMSIKDLKENNSSTMVNYKNNQEEINLSSKKLKTEENINIKSSLNFDNTKKLNNLEGNLNTKSFFKANILRTFNLLGNNLILLTFQKDSITYLYKLDKDLKKKKDIINPVGLSASNGAFHMSVTMDEIRETNEKEEIFVNRISKNIKQILNVTTNEDYSKLIYTVEVYNRNPPYNANSETSVFLYLFNRKNMKISFEKEIFNNFFHKHQIKGFTFCEKNSMFYAINENKSLRCFDYRNNFFLMQNKLRDQPLFITCCPNNNLIGISFEKKFSLYFQLREKLMLFSEFDVSHSLAKFSEKGDYIVIYGENNFSKMFNIYLIETFYLNTVHIIENFKYKIKKMNWFDNDRYLFALFENNNIFGWNVNFDFLTVNLLNRFKDKEIDIESTYFRMIFKHFVKGNDYEDFEYDFKNDIIILAHKNIDKISFYGKTGRKLLGIIEKQKIPKTMKIIQDLRCLILGMQNGSIKILRWPFDFNENLSIKKYQLFEISLHTGPVIDVIVTNNLKYLISASKDGSIYYSELYVEINGSIKGYNLLLENDKFKPKIEVFLGLNDVLQYKTLEIRNSDATAQSLKKKKKLLEKHNKELTENKMKDHEREIKMLDDQKKEACVEEHKKADNLIQDTADLKTNVENELEERLEEHEKEKATLLEKYDNKLTLYKTEISRLQRELKDLEELIESKFKILATTQSDNFNSLFNNYWDIFNNLKNEIDKNLKLLILTNAEFDEAFDSAKTEYDKLIFKLNSEMKEDIDNAKKIIQDKDQELKKIFMEEKTFKNLLDKKVMESDNVIKKNVQIKQNIIDTTQRTITLQEQLLETEKNLLKIDKKMDDLNNKNKHLEQIRFVLEHRMMALEKEKAPLEGQCYYLEKQKFNLQEEFNELILEINNKNQTLENKQSQLKACLIQNFEVNDHMQYLKKKLMHLQKEIKSFILRFQDSENKKVMLSIQENKATTVALHLRRFYDTYFETNIDQELLNYKHYSQKLQEETEKINISNNLDLILRDKGEEKLLSEKDKMIQIIGQKEKGFKRMEEENTILISECNRLRKNLHEVYMHVIDIEKKFEDLTKINPMLNKTEIVNQIKTFIKQTHIKIKNRYDEDQNRNPDGYDEQKEQNNESFNFYNNAYYKNNEYTEQTSKIYQGEILRSVNDGQSQLNNQNNELDFISERIKNIVTPLQNSRNENIDQENDKNEYENFLVLPDINVNQSRVMNNEKDKKNVHESVNFTELPAIDNYGKNK